MSKKHIPVLHIEFGKTSYFGEKSPSSLQPAGANVDELIKYAKLAEPMMDNIMRALIKKANIDINTINKTPETLEKLGLDPKGNGIPTIDYKSYKLADTKRRDRIIEKAGGEYEGDFRDIRDIARGQVRLEDLNQIAALASVMQWSKDYDVDLPHDARVTVASNRFKKPTDTGYSSFKINVTIPVFDRHHTVEYQLVHGEFEDRISSDTKNRFHTNSHDSYALERTFQDFARDPNASLTPKTFKRFQQANAVCKAIHEKARKATRLDDIQFKPFERLRLNSATKTMEQYERQQQPELVLG